MIDKDKIKIFALDNSEIIGNKICKLLHVPLSKSYKTIFRDGEILTGPAESVRNKHVFLICSSLKPVNVSIMETLIFIDALKRSSAKSIVIVMTYYGYARQDRKNSGRQPISAKLHADLLTRTGMTKLITVDLHNPSIQGFFNTPVDDLRGQYVLASYVNRDKKYVVVSPDHGGVVRAHVLAKLITYDKGEPEIAIIDKVRTNPNESKIRGILGNVKGRNCLIVDDMIDTGGTIINAANSLIEAGATEVSIMASHGLFSEGFDRFENSKFIKNVYITNSLQSVYSIKSSKLIILGLSYFISKVIEATCDSKSITAVYTQIAKNIRRKKK